MWTPKICHNKVKVLLKKIGKHDMKCLKIKFIETCHIKEFDF
jgi:hypothetical protein